MNQQTLNISPTKAMHFDRTLWRLLYQIRHANNTFGPVYMSKIDLSNCFYRLWLHPEDTHRLVVLLLTREHERDLIGIPLTNPMRWVSSPPNFWLAQRLLRIWPTQIFGIPRGGPRLNLLAPHRFYALSGSIPETPPSTAPSKSHSKIFSSAKTPFFLPVKYWDIYVDDFCGLVQGKQWTCRIVQQILFQALNKVFQPVDDNNTKFQQEPASVKKLKKRDARWSTVKIILGWLLNTVEKTIVLPEHCALHLIEIMESIPYSQRSIATNAWQKIVGKLVQFFVFLKSQRLFLTPYTQVYHIKCTQTDNFS